MPNKKHAKTNVGSLLVKYYYLIFALLIIISFGRSVGNDYALDDNYYTLNPNVQNGLNNIGTYFTTYTIQTPEENHGYRPITAITFGLEKQIFGSLSPQRAHLISLMLYYLLCVLLFNLLQDLLPEKNKFLNFLICIVFLIHPIHTEVVFNIKSRDELLSMIAGLGALKLCLKYFESRSIHYLVSVIPVMIVGLLSKPSCLALIGLIPFSLWYFSRVSIRTAIIVFISSAFLALAGLKFINRKVIDEENKREFHYQENPMYIDTPKRLDRIPMAVYTTTIYMGKHLFPYPLSSYYGYAVYDFINWKDWKFWRSLLVFIFLLAFLFLFGKKYPIITFGIWWFLLSMSLFSNFIRPAPGIIADRFAFVGSLGYAIIVGVIIDFILRRDSTITGSKSLHFISKAVVVSIVTLALLWNNERATHWKSKLDLFRQDVLYYPNSAKLNTLLANEAYGLIPRTPDRSVKVKLVDEAVDHYEKAVSIFPQYAHAWNNLGTMYGTFHKDYAKAIDAYQKALSIKPNYPVASYSLGYCFEQIGDIDQAVLHYQHTLDLDPNFRQARYRILNLGR